MNASPQYDAVEYWAKELQKAKQIERNCREHLGNACRRLKKEGVSDRAISERADLSRARIQQLRTVET